MHEIERQINPGRTQELIETEIPGMYTLRHPLKNVQLSEEYLKYCELIRARQGGIFNYFRYCIRNKILPF